MKRTKTHTVKRVLSDSPLDGKGSVGFECMNCSERASNVLDLIWGPCTPPNHHPAAITADLEATRQP